jgi:hypothetical protein
MFEKIALLPKDSNRLPSAFITGESITNTNNSANMWKNSKLCLGMPLGTRRNCLRKKTRDKKSCDTVPLRLVLRHYENTGRGEFRPEKCEVKTERTPVLDSPPGPGLESIDYRY